MTPLHYASQSSEYVSELLDVWSEVKDIFVHKSFRSCLNEQNKVKN